MHAHIARYSQKLPICTPEIETCQLPHVATSCITHGRSGPISASQSAVYVHMNRRCRMLCTQNTVHVLATPEAHMHGRTAGLPAVQYSIAEQVANWNSGLLPPAASLAVNCVGRTSNAESRALRMLFTGKNYHLLVAAMAATYGITSVSSFSREYDALNKFSSSAAAFVACRSSSVLPITPERRSSTFSSSLRLAKDALSSAAFGLLLL